MTPVDATEDFFVTIATSNSVKKSVFPSVYKDILLVFWFMPNYHGL